MLSVVSRKFFSNYIFRPDAPELSREDKRKALISSIFLGIFTLGICHLICLIKYRNHVFKLILLQKDPLLALTKFAPKDKGAALIDFTHVKPSNILQIFSKESEKCKGFGDVWITDSLDCDDSSKFYYKFPYKYQISVVSNNRNGCISTSRFMFTMTAEGKVESYGNVFANFNDYIVHRMSSVMYQHNWCTFTQADFYPARTLPKVVKLRKKL